MVFAARWAVFGLLFLGSWQPAAQAQGADAYVQDSLPSLTPDELRTVVRDAGGLPHSGPRLLRGAFAALRLFELQGERADADVARSLFERVLEHKALEAWTHYGLGLLHARYAAVQMSSRGGVLSRVVTVDAFAGIFGNDPRSRAHREFRLALELEPQLIPAVLAMAELALETRKEDDLHEARNALVRIGESKPERRLWLALSSVESALGMPEAAQNAAERLVRIDSTDAFGHYALARALFLQPDKVGLATQHYLLGLVRADARASDLYLRDASYILTPEELRQVRDLPVTARAGWLESRWQMRAARAGVTLAERLAEHYTRMARAAKEYRREMEFGAPPVGSLIVEGLADLPFDDRGVLLVRHGQPIDIITTIANAFPLNQTWVYSRPDTAGYRLFNFMKYPGAPDYRLMAELPPCDSSRHSKLDPSVQSGLVTPFDGRWVESVIRYYEDRGRYDPRFHQLAARCQAATFRHTAGRTLMDTTTVRLDATDLGMELRRDALQALQTDSDQPDFDSSVPFIHRLYAFRGDDALTELTAAVLIPGDRMSPGQTAGGKTVYPVGVSLILFDTSTVLFRTDSSARVMRVDTTLYFESSRVLARDDFLRLHVTLRAPLGPGLMYRLVVRDLSGPKTGGVATGKVMPRQLVSRTLELSDLVVAESDSGRWRRGSVGLALLPPHEVDADRPFVLFYEIYNLPAGSSYSAEVSFEPVRSGALSGLRRLFGGRRGVRLKFDGTTASAVTQVAHRITSELPPGEYRLRIAVSDARSQRDSRETKLVILPSSTQRSRTEPARR